MELNGDEFETHAFHTGKISDQATSELKEKSDFFYAGLGSNQTAIQAIRSANLDFGMDPNVQCLTSAPMGHIEGFS